MTSAAIEDKILGYGYTTSSGIAFDGSTANGVLTYKDADEATVESTLTYDAEVLNIGADDDGGASIKRSPHSDEAGGDLSIQGGDAGGTDKTGGSLRLYSGAGTGAAYGGDIHFYAGNRDGSSGSTNNLPNLMATIDGSAGDFVMSGIDTISGKTNSDFTISSDGKLTFRIDADADETSQEFRWLNSTTEIMKLDEDGNLRVDGNLELGHATDTTIARSSAGVVTIEGNTIKTSADYHYQYISFLGNSTVQANGDWEFPGGNGISNHTWAIDSNQNAVTVGSTTISVAQQYQHAGVRVPYAGKLVGVFGAGRNTNANRQFAAGLFVGVPDWGTTNAINATLRSYAAANNESGSYQNRPSKIEDLTRDFDLSAGDMIYPAIRGDGTSADTIQVSMTVVIKTLIP
jgi:hypothetical protein